MAAPVLADYTTCDAVRAALGVEVKELADATLQLPMYVAGLTADLRDIAAALPAEYATVKAITYASRTADENAFYDAVEQFAPVAVANALLPALPLLAPKTITDGKAGMGRVADPFKDTLKQVPIQFSKFLARLTNAYNAYKSSTEEVVIRPFLSISSPSADPVAGT